MEDLVTWLRGQLDDDERRTERDREVAALLREQAEIVSRIYGDADPPKDDMRPADRLWWTARDAADALDRDAARVLAEVDAKRRILDLIENGDGGTTHDECMQSAGYQVCCFLALPYAGRDGYREEWRP